MFIFETLYSVLVFIIAIPILIVFFQVLAAIILPKKSIQNTVDITGLSVVALVPAHNESTNIIPTIASLKAQSINNLKILVVADNCDDDTYSVSKAQNVEVVERFNQTLRGKGYALDYGIEFLKQSSSPDFVVVVDADCIVEPDALKMLVTQSHIHNRPAQASYLMYSINTTSIKTKISEFAWLLKNLVRPLGNSKLTFPCQLTGSGMAFPWAVLSKINFATGHIVEDMKLGLDFATAGHAPLFCAEASVYSYFPVNDEGLKTQRTRWEHGHLGIIVKDVPKYILNSIRTGSLDLFVLAMDLLVPPLSLMVMLLGIVLSVGLLMSILTSTIIMSFSVAIYFLSLFVGTIFLFWAVYARNVIGIKELFSIPYYIFLKLPIYIKFIFNRQSEWVRSKRD